MTDPIPDPEPEQEPLTEKEWDVLNRILYGPEYCPSSIYFPPLHLWYTDRQGTMCNWCYKVGDKGQ